MAWNWRKESSKDKETSSFKERMLLAGADKSFCNCWNLTKSDSCLCGEGNLKCPAWKWSTIHKTDSAFVSENGQRVNFHDSYSKGTACVRGDTAFVDGHQYFWEIKLPYPVYGTSVMIGVGTESVDVKKYKSRFCHLLGDDDESWGLNFDGWLRHNNKSFTYHPQAGFSNGSIVGVHLDLWQGKLEYYLNRQPLGVAFQGLRNKVLYPMVSSTAAKSGIHLIYSAIQQHSLVYLALRQCASLNQSSNLPYGIRKMLDECWWRFSKPLKKDLGMRVGLGRSPKSEIYVLIDSDDEEDENEGSGALALRMKRVLENSAGIASEQSKYPKLMLRSSFKRAKLKASK